MCIAALAALLPARATPQGYDPNLFGALRWRLIGPFRGGLTVAAIVMWSVLVSSILPLLLKKVRIDPAVVSAPMIATIVDGTGLRSTS